MPRNYLLAALLLLIGHEPSHGYELSGPLAELGLEGLGPSRLYRSLRRLESDGLVESWWDHSTAGPARRTYELTATGRATVAGCAASLQRNQDLVSQVLDRYEALVAKNRGPI